MDELQKNKAVINLERKLKGEPGGSDYVQELRSLDRYGLEDKLKDLAKYRQAIISTREKDVELKAAKRRVSGLNSPYNSQLNGNRDKMRFIGLLLQEMEGFTPTMDVELED